jgi:hypothetical protein
MSYNILNKKVNFQGAEQGTIEDVVDTHQDQTISGLKTITYLTGTHILASNDIKVLGDVSSSANISASYFYGDGSNLTGVDKVITALNNQTANRLVTIGATTTELDGEADLTFNGTVLNFNATSISGSGNISGSYFYGNGFNLTSVNASTVTLASNGGLTNVPGGLIVNPTGATEITSADGDDYLLVSDDTDAGALKRITCQRVANLYNAAVTTYGGNTAGRVILANGAGDIQGQANLVWQGSSTNQLMITGSVSASVHVSASFGWFGTSMTAGAIELGDASGLAGAGLADNGGELDIQVTGAVRITSDKVGITGSIAGVGLSFDGGVDSISEIKLDLGSLPDTNLAVADDYIVFLDGGATGDPKKEQFADIVTNMASTGLDATNGVLTVDVSDFMAGGSQYRVLTSTGADAFSGSVNLNFYGSALGVTGSISGSSTLEVGSHISGSGDFKLTGDAVVDGGLTVKGPLIADMATVTNFTGDDANATIPITAATAQIDANGSVRTGMRFAGGGVAGQILVVINTGGENVTFANSDAAALLRGTNSNKDTIRPSEAHVFVSDGTYWNHVGGGTTDEGGGLTAG